MLTVFMMAALGVIYSVGFVGAFVVMLILSAGVRGAIDAIARRFYGR